jgi:hypothetical protein
VPPRVRHGGDGAVALWQVLSSAIIAWVLPEVLVGLVWEYSCSFIPQGILYLVFFVFFLFFHLSQGHFVRSFGGNGSKLGQFKSPSVIAATDEFVLVVDHSNERCNARFVLKLMSIGCSVQVYSVDEPTVLRSMTHPVLQRESYNVWGMAANAFGS